MQIGEIIKINRTKKGMTQAELCEHICSITHLSKIESGNTSFAEEIIDLLCKKLNISIEEEVYIYSYLDELLNKFYQSITFCDISSAKKMKQELENYVDYLEYTTLNNLYSLYKLRYFILLDSKNEVNVLAKSIIENECLLGKFNNNLLSHSLGIYYVYKQNSHKALSYFHKVGESYKEDDYFYYLSLSYYYTGSYILSYHYVMISIECFRKSNNYKKVIDSEMLLALLLSTNDEFGIKHSLEKYQKLLILISDANDSNRKSRIYHNIAYNYLLLKEYENASVNYLLSMELKEKNSYLYLTSLYSYIYCIFKTKKNFTKDIELKKRILEGIAISKGLQNEKYLILLKLQLMNFNQDPQIYEFIYERALPYFFENSHFNEAKEFGTLAFNYYKHKCQFQISSEIADLLLQTN